MRLPRERVYQRIDFWSSNSSAVRRDGASRSRAGGAESIDEVGTVGPSSHGSDGAGWRG